MFTIICVLPGALEQLRHRDEPIKNFNPAAPGLQMLVAYSRRRVYLYPNWRYGFLGVDDRLEVTLKAGDILFFTSALVHSGAELDLCEHRPDSGSQDCFEQGCCSFALHAYCPTRAYAVPRSSLKLQTELVGVDGEISLL